MKLLRIGQPGHERVGVLGDDDMVRLLPEQVGDLVPERWDAVLDAARSVSTGTAGDKVPIGDAGRVGAPLRTVGKIVCAGLNYADHAREGGNDLPTEPVLFLKTPDTLTGPHDDILMPPGSEKTDWEIELAVVIGRDAACLGSTAEARDVVAGFAIANDVSERNFQLERGGQWCKGKNWPTFCPLGPYLVTPDEVADPQNLTMELLVNGDLRQQSSTAEMVFPVDHLIWYVSQFIPLRAGDLVLSGTPAGVGAGMTPPQYLAEGDIVEARIDGLGTQRQRVGRWRRHAE